MYGTRFSTSSFAHALCGAPRGRTKLIIKPHALYEADYEFEYCGFTCAGAAGYDHCAVLQRRFNGLSLLRRKRYSKLLFKGVYLRVYAEHKLHAVARSDAHKPPCAFAFRAVHAGQEYGVRIVYQLIQHVARNDKLIKHLLGGKSINMQKLAGYA